MRSLDEAAGRSVGELALRRYRAGELPADERTSIESQLNEDPDLRRRLQALESEQQAFERQVPFERFAGGVERAHRVPSKPARALSRRTLWAGLFAATAAAAGLVLVIDTGSDERPINRLKGEGETPPVLVRVARADGSQQREVHPGRPVRLEPDERVRVGIRNPEVDVEVVVVSVDEHGLVSTLYPVRGRAAALPRSAEFRYLPDAIAFDGKGQESLVVFLADRPISADAVAASVRDAFVRAGRIEGFRPPTPEGVAAFEFPFEKP